MRSASQVPRSDPPRYRPDRKTVLSRGECGIGACIPMRAEGELLKKARLLCDVCS
jgi:hypothetical protein